MSDIVYGYTWDPPQGVRPALLTGSYYQAPPARIKVRLTAGDWVLDYPLVNAGLYRVETKGFNWRPRHAQTAHLYPPGTIYCEDGRRAKTYHTEFITFAGGEQAGLERLVHPIFHYARFLDPQGLIGSHLRAIAQIGHESGSEGFWQAQSHFCQILQLLLQSSPQEEETRLIGDPSKPDERSHLVREVERYLRDHLMQPVTLAIMARSLHISVSTLAHQYRAQTGITPMGRLTQLRIDQVKRLLVTGQSLKMIASATGFCDEFHLSKTFKRVEGVSPRTYLTSLGRRQAQTDE